MSLLKKFYKYGIIQQGDFILKSGQKSNIYVDLRRVISFPKLHQEYAIKLVDSIKSNTNFTTTNTRICGTPYGAVSFTSLVSVELDIPMIFLRKEQKQHGTKKIIEGIYNKGDNVILIEDVTTTGGSVIDAAKILEEHGLKVSIIYSILSRSPVEIYYNDLKINSLTRLDNKSLSSIINEKNTNICLAADVPTLNDLINIINTVGEYICILKIHSDMYKDFNDDIIKQICDLKEKYNFKIWEDRKFADIGQVMKRQFEDSGISEWADIISVHPISGKKSLEQLINIDIILIAEMSSEGNLMSKEYQKNVIEIAESTNNIIGVVSQHKLSDKLLHFVPGIKFNDKTFF